MLYTYILQNLNSLFYPMFCISLYRYNIVPIVMGASVEEHSRISPPHAFIHVDKFKPPFNLSKYSNYLNKNYHLLINILHGMVTEMFMCGDQDLNVASAYWHILFHLSSLHGIQIIIIG